MPASASQHKIRILSLDGGGIYCFSGTSSGAVNALLLAAEEHPRELITSESTLRRRPRPEEPRGGKHVHDNSNRLRVDKQI